MREREEEKIAIVFWSTLNTYFVIHSHILHYLPEAIFAFVVVVVVVATRRTVTYDEDQGKMLMMMTTTDKICSFFILFYFLVPSF